MIFEDIPVYLGYRKDPSAKHETLPSTMQFQFDYDADLGMVRQIPNEHLENFLRHAYVEGSTIGTPLSHEPLAQPYAVDFIKFIGKHAGSMSLKRKRRESLLEIGAGNGYLLSRLRAMGWESIGIEPGDFGLEHRKYGVTVVRDFFPSNLVMGEFDAAVAYGVLEHIVDPREFLRDLKSQLSENGVIFLSVPDCTVELEIGDPSCLVHEHFSYFDSDSLSRLLCSVGLKSITERSIYGRTIFAAATHDDDQDCDSHYSEKKENRQKGLLYPQKSFDYRAQLMSSLESLVNEYSVGIWAPARALSFLPLNKSFRFFDDDESIWGTFLPPFHSPIQSMDELLADPVEILFVASRTFFSEIKASLLDQGFQGRILGPEDLWRKI